MTSAEQIPEKFFGRFVLEKSENFDEFLSAKGVGWILRKMIQLASVTKVISKGTSEGSYNMENLTSKKNTKYQDWELGKTFEAEGFDGNKHKITFDFKNDTLTEHHVRLNEDGKGNEAETYYFTIDENDKLVLKMENNSIVCRRWFKRDKKN
ncbi:unnamed protein product [Auanema sp. JU1783]|nr:unnamed protein product [Auanema sp. JU1783]